MLFSLLLHPVAFHPDLKAVLKAVPSAYLLVAHGSRDPRSQTALEHLAMLVAKQLLPRLLHFPEPVAASAHLGNGSTPRLAFPLVETAVLELGPLPLHQQIQQSAQRAVAAGYALLQIVPLFLLPGVHVMEDIPAEVAAAQRALGNSITLVMRPHLGSHPNLGSLLLDPMAPWLTAPQTGKIVMAHGSRRPGSAEPVEATATQLGALAAYWTTAPSLEVQVAALVKQGCTQIAILPYFLFEGGITDAIAEQVNGLAQQFPYTCLHLARPFGATSALAERVVDLFA